MGTARHAAADAEDWPTVGAALLHALREAALPRGAVQNMIFCGHLDGPKREFLRSIGFHFATAVWVNGM